MVALCPSASPRDVEPCPDLSGRGRGTAQLSVPVAVGRVVVGDGEPVARPVTGPLGTNKGNATTEILH